MTSGFHCLRWPPKLSVTISSPFFPSPSSISISILFLPYPSSIALRLIRLSDITFILSVLFNFTQNAFFSHLPRGKLFPEENGPATRRKPVGLTLNPNSSRALLSRAPLPPDSPALPSVDGTRQRVVKKRSRARSSVLTWVSAATSTHHILNRVLTSMSSGTTNSAVAVMEGKAPRIIENAEGMCKIFLPPGRRSFGYDPGSWRSVMFK